MKRNKWLSMMVLPQRFRFQRPTDFCYPNRQYQLLVCPSCQASDRFVSVCVFSPRSHRSFPRRQKGNHHENPYDNREHHQPDTTERR